MRAASASAGLSVIALLALLTGCEGSAPGPAGGAEDLGAALPAAPAHPAQGRSPRGMVVTGSPHATEAGVRMLARGGNAVDAAVAAAFTLAVTEPTQSGLGGRTQLLVRMADGTLHGIDGTTEVPAGYDPAAAPVGEHGPGAVGIPGTVAALTRVLEEHGTLPLVTVLEPARHWARDGHALTAGEAGRLAGLIPELDSTSAVVRRFGGPGGAPLQPGDRLVQAELVGVLDALAEKGRDGFYRGWVADRLAEDMASRGGFVTREDLEGYRAEDAVVGSGRFRGLELSGSYLPASGVTVIEILQILDRFRLPEEEGLRAAFLAEALEAGFQDRETAESWDPAAAVDWLTSDTLADRRAREIAARLAARGVRVILGSPERVAGGAEAAAARAAEAEAANAEVGRARDAGRGAVATLPAARSGYDRARMSPVAAPAAEHPFTTHLSVADTFGNVVALTQSLGPTGGARVVTPGLGFLYASTLGGYLSGGGPGYRPWSSQAPLLVLRAGEPWLVMGGAGARRILSALVSTVTRVVDGGVPLEEAMAAPRLHPTGGTILVEEGWAAGDELRALGYTVEERPREYFARLNVVEVEGDAFLGVGDPRWVESAAAGPGRGGL